MNQPTSAKQTVNKTKVKKYIIFILDYIKCQSLSWTLEMQQATNIFFSVLIPIYESDKLIT